MPAGGARVVRDNRGLVLSALRDRAEQALNIAALGTKADAINAITKGTKSGKTYRRGAIKRKVKTGGRKARQYAAMGLRGKADEDSGKTAFVVGFRYHRASAAGEAPASDTGKLASSIRVVRLGRLRRKVVVYAPYGAVLELKLNRPFLLPAYRKRAEELRRNLRRVHIQIADMPGLKQ